MAAKKTTKKDAPKKAEPKKAEPKVMSNLDMIDELEARMLALQSECFMARKAVHAVRKLRRVVKSNTILSGE
jgi:hypothetical protein